MTDIAGETRTRHQTEKRQLPGCPAQYAGITHADGYTKKAANF